ncbi:MAG: hypothetical protein JRI62_08720 [Deltaproteobacteria bacterium]|nr:hypothetical protein [Deltaproteobacteria bacterium]
MDKQIIGIQGGKGSYNEVAILKYIHENIGHDAEIKYLYSTANVLDALRTNQISHGQFAISNSIGGYVTESMEAIAAFLSSGCGINVIATYEIPIVHRLIAHSSSRIEDIRKVISHPQALKQCANHLKINYKELELVEGVDEYSDPAKIAEGISNNEFPISTATLSNPHIAVIYGLKVISDELQDSDSNITKFILVEKCEKT